MVLYSIGILKLACLLENSYIFLTKLLVITRCFANNCYCLVGKSNAMQLCQQISVRPSARSFALQLPVAAFAKGKLFCKRTEVLNNNTGQPQLFVSLSVCLAVYRLTLWPKCWSLPPLPPTNSTMCCIICSTAKQHLNIVAPVPVSCLYLPDQYTISTAKQHSVSKRCTIEKIITFD